MLPKPGVIPHGLPAPLIVSVTSYPPRFRTSSLTLKCLLSQSVRADRTILWVASADLAKLPEDVLALQVHGLTIESCDDLGSYKKIIPALETFPGAYLATADDDCYYPGNWLETLVEAQKQQPGCIICHEARVVSYADTGEALSYKSWPRATSSAQLPLLPVGFGGVLYPPDSLPGEATNRAAFRELSPTADDLWLKWMAATLGTRVHLVKEGGPLYNWPGSQHVRLVQTNLHDGGNDRQVQALRARYGLPHGDGLRQAGAA